MKPIPRTTSVRGTTRDPVFFSLLDPGSGSGMEKNPDPGSRMKIPNLIFEYLVRYQIFG
jgi:hypothetical protein